MEDQTGFKIKYGDKLQWPEQESATSLDTLIQNPMDYVINNLLHIDGTGVADMQAVYRTEGNVGHAVIADLFDKKEGIEGRVAPIHTSERTWQSILTRLSTASSFQREPCCFKARTGLRQI